MWSLLSLLFQIRTFFPRETMAIIIYFNSSVSTQVVSRNAHNERVVSFWGDEDHTLKEFKKVFGLYNRTLTEINNVSSPIMIDQTKFKLVILILIICLISMMATIIGGLLIYLKRKSGLRWMNERETNNGCLDVIITGYNNKSKKKKKQDNNGDHLLSPEEELQLYQERVRQPRDLFWNNFFLDDHPSRLISSRTNEVSF